MVDINNRDCFNQMKSIVLFNYIKLCNLKNYNLYIRHKIGECDMKRKGMTLIIAFLMIFTVGCGKTSLKDEYLNIIQKSNDVKSYTYEIENDLLTAKTWVTDKKAKKEQKYKSDNNKVHTSILNLDEDKYYLYEKSLNAAQESSAKNRNINEYRLPFTKKEHLNNLKEEFIKKITDETIDDIECRKVEIEEKQNNSLIKLFLWYDKETNLLIKYQIFKDDKIINETRYLNVEVTAIDDKEFMLPEDVIMQEK